jgi:hypothetical protein
MEEFNELNMDSDPTTTFKPPTYFQIIFDKMISDMRFVGMFTIIYGAITCLTIIGALIGIPTIIIGLRMREAADQFAIFRMNNDANAMRSGFELQGRFFRITKILIIVGLVLTVLYIIFIIVLISSGFGALMNMQSSDFQSL